MIVTVAVLIIISASSAANAELWDLIILTDMENSVILPGQSPVIAGMVVDHASKPIKLVQVHIRAGQESIFTVTDEQGQFRTVLNDFNRIPGTYIVSIVGKTPDGKTGIAETEFQVKGDLKITSILEEKLSTPEAKKYLEANEEDFAKNPIGFTLFNYYQKLYQKYLEDVKISEQLAEEQVFIEQQKSIAKELRQQAIEEFNPTYGIFSGYKYDDYIASLNPEIRDVIINQLNFTKNLFEEAQTIREGILLDGGSEEEARQAYLEKIAITKEILNNYEVKDFKVDETSKNNTKVELIPLVTESIEQTTEQEKFQIDVKNANMKVGFDGKTIVVNVNGTTVKFFVNATGIYQVD